MRKALAFFSDNLNMTNDEHNNDDKISIFEIFRRIQTGNLKKFI